MKIDLLCDNEMFSIAELSAMLLNFEIFKYHELYAPFGLVENREVRAEYLKLTTGKRARANTATAYWVEVGDVLPKVLQLVQDR